MSIEQDLVLREYWIGYLRERSLEVLGEQFHITPCAICYVETSGDSGIKSVRNTEIRQLRAQYRAARRNQMPKFHIKAIAKRNNVCEATVTRRKMALIQAKADWAYSRRIAS